MNLIYPIGANILLADWVVKLMVKVVLEWVMGLYLMRAVWLIIY